MANQKPRGSYVVSAFRRTRVARFVLGAPDADEFAKQYSGFYFSKARGQKLWQRYGFYSIDDLLKGIAGAELS